MDVRITVRDMVKNTSWQGADQLAIYKFNLRLPRNISRYSGHKFHALFNHAALLTYKCYTLGVRYNAEKKKVGNYYTTPIYRFRMKCHLCDNHFEIETDPKVC